VEDPVLLPQGEEFPAIRKTGYSRKEPERDVPLGKLFL